MGRGRSGRVSLSGTSSANRAAHPHVTDIDQYGVMNAGRKSTQHSGDGPSNASVQWFKDNFGYNDSDARNAADVFLYYSRGGDKAMHNDTDEYNGKINNGVIDRAIDNPRSPVFAAEHHRGLFFYDEKFDGDARSALNDILKNGMWRENGATSFSSSLGVAHNFALRSSADHLSGVSITIHHPGGSGMPMKHLSSFQYENEVIHSRKQMKAGYKITRHKWSPNGKTLDIWLAN